jgi:hypothetical protein
MTDRRPNPSDPTAERTSEQFTPSGGGPDMEQGRRRDGDELVPREGEASRATDRRADEADRDPVMPDDDTGLGTKI